MSRFILFFAIVFSYFFGKAQGSPCYFLKDTGTVESETSNSVVELSDGTIYVTGVQGNGPNGNDDIALLKFDACGNVLWIKYFGDSLVNQGLFINKTSDEKLVIIGTTGNASSNNDILLTKLDNSGNILFQKRYNSGVNQSAKYIEQTADKGFIFCGDIADNYGSNDIYVVKIDSLGIVQWTQQIGSTGNEYANAVHETSDRNFIVVGDENSYGNGGYDIEIIKIDKHGNIIWDKTFGDNLNNGSQGIIELSNGNYLSYGETEIPNNVAFDFFIEAIDTSGFSISRHTFGGSAADALFSLIELPGAEFMCTGYSRSYNGFQPYDVVLFKIDSAGQMKWLKNIASPGIDIGYEIIPSINGDYLITGLFADNNGNYFLIHSDTIANTTVNINSLGNEKEITLYPNPCNKLFYIDLPDNDKKATMEIISLLGEKLKIVDLNSRKNCIDIDNFNPGIYNIVIKSDKEIISVKKLLINTNKY